MDTCHLDPGAENGPQKKTKRVFILNVLSGEREAFVEFGSSSWRSKKK
jgi:hypothetical protein